MRNYTAQDWGTNRLFRHRRRPFTAEKHCFSDATHCVSDGKQPLIGPQIDEQKNTISSNRSQKEQSHNRRFLYFGLS